MITCTKCGADKPAADFPRARGKRNGRQCKTCRLVYLKAWYAQNRDHVTARRRSGYDPHQNRAMILKNRYGLTLEQHADILKAQDGACAICKREPCKRGLFVDHDHRTGQVRGLLCNRCNSVLGYMADSVELLEACKAYLSVRRLRVVNL